MRIAIVNKDTGLVENVVEMGLTPDGPTNKEDTIPKEGYLWIESEVAGRGMFYANGKFQDKSNV